MAAQDWKFRSRRRGREASAWAFHQEPTPVGAVYGEIVIMRLAVKALLIMGGCICSVVSLWGAVAVFGTWFLLPRDPSATVDHDIWVRCGLTALFIGASALSGVLSRLALKKAFRSSSRAARM
jgi:hypothetical protein